MNLKFVTIIITIFIVSVISDEFIPKRRRKYCHFNEMMRCIDPFRRFTGVINGTGIVTTEKEFDLFCGFITKSMLKCMQQWVKRCGNPMHQELMDVMFSQPYAESFKRFCDPNGIIRPRFLKHAQCLHDKVKLSPSYREKCVKSIQSGFEYIQHKHTKPEISFRAFCCVYNRWEKCMCDHLTENCGPESPQIILDLIRAGTLQLLVQFCPMEAFDPTTNECIELLPPVGAKALGAKSNSYFSYMFSYLCPNVGYGIVD